MEITPSDPAAQFQQWKRDIERQLHNLATTRTAQHTSIADDDGNVYARIGAEGIRIFDTAGNVLVALDGDGLRMFDAEGDVRTIVGRLNGGDTRGVAIFDPGGVQPRFLADDDGLHDPYLGVPCIEADDFRVVTAGTFEATHRSQFENISHQGLYCWVTVTTATGTTAEIRLRNATTGEVTEAAAIGALASVDTQFRWLHGSDLGAGPIRFEVQARRTGGAGDVNVYKPFGMTMVDPGLCVADGLP